MTLALCLKCGGVKFGSLSRCQRCEFEPQTEHDVAYSVVLSTHHFSMETLKTMGAAIALTGKIPKLAKDSEEQFVKSASNFMNSALYKGVRGKGMKPCGFQDERQTSIITFTIRIFEALGRAARALFDFK